MNALLSLLDIDTHFVSCSPFYCFWLLHWNLCHTDSIISASLIPFPVSSSLFLLLPTLDRKIRKGSKGSTYLNNFINYKKCKYYIYSCFFVVYYDHTKLITVFSLLAE